MLSIDSWSTLSYEVWFTDSHEMRRTFHCSSLDEALRYIDAMSVYYDDFELVERRFANFN